MSPAPMRRRSSTVAGLKAVHVLASGKRGHRLLEMQRVRRGDVDDVDVVTPKHAVEISRPAAKPNFCAAFSLRPRDDDTGFDILR